MTTINTDELFKTLNKDNHICTSIEQTEKHWKNVAAEIVKSMVYDMKKERKNMLTSSFKLFLYDKQYNCLFNEENKKAFLNALNNQFTGKKKMEVSITYNGLDVFPLVIYNKKPAIYDSVSVTLKLHTN